MSSYIIYDKLTGKIRSIYGGSEPDLQISATEAFLEGTVDDSKYYIVDGAITAYPNKPDNPFIEFDYVEHKWVDPRTEEQKLQRQIAENRVRRKKELSASDWVVARSIDTGQPVPPEWQTYRQALRDITNQSDPFNIVWPTAPG